MKNLAVLLPLPFLLTVSCSRGGSSQEDTPLDASGIYSALLTVYSDNCYSTACLGQTMNMVVEVAESNNRLSLRACGPFHSPVGTTLIGEGEIMPLLPMESGRYFTATLSLGSYLTLPIVGKAHTDGAIGFGGTIQFHEPPVRAPTASGCTYVSVGYACTDTTCGGPCSWEVSINGSRNDSATPCQ